MTKIKQRDIATSFTATIFIVMAITGLLMFFHILDAYTKNLHEILGLAFVLAVVFHVMFNWKGMRSYFSKKIFGLASLLILAVSIGFITNVKEGTNPKRAMIDSILATSTKNSFTILSTDANTAKMRLEKAGIVINTADSIKDIANENKISPFKIVEIITTK